MTQQVLQEGVQRRSFEAEEAYIAHQDDLFGRARVETSTSTHATSVEENPLLGRDFSTSISTFGGDIQSNDTGPYLTFYQSSPVLAPPVLPLSLIHI